MSYVVKGQSSIIEDCPASMTIRDVLNPAHFLYLYRIMRIYITANGVFLTPTSPARPSYELKRFTMRASVLLQTNPPPLVLPPPPSPPCTLFTSSIICGAAPSRSPSIPLSPPPPLPPAITTTGAGPTTT